MTCRSPVLCYFHSRWRPLSLHSVVGDAPQWLLSHLSPSCHCVNASRALPFPQTFIWMAQSTLCVGVFCPLPGEWLFLICPYNLQCKRDGFSAWEPSPVWKKAIAYQLGPPHLLPQIKVLWRVKTKPSMTCEKLSIHAIWDLNPFRLIKNQLNMEQRNSLLKNGVILLCHDLLTLIHFKSMSLNFFFSLRFLSYNERIKWPQVVKLSICYS